MTRIPILPTLLVLGAIAMMVRLGIWQLQRADEKEALLARYSVAAELPEIAFPAMASDESSLFRRSAANCQEPGAAKVEGGLNRDGVAGWRHTITCGKGAEGQGLTVDIGWSSRFDETVTWNGGPVRGIISRQPDHRSLLAKAMGAGKPPGLMLVLTVPAPGLKPSALPSLQDIPNNHLAYAVQWFVFAGVAAAIYGLALWQRRRA